MNDQLTDAKVKLLALGEEAVDPPLWPLGAALAAGGALGCFMSATSGREGSGASATPTGPEPGLVELLARITLDLWGATDHAPSA